MNLQEMIDKVLMDEQEKGKSRIRSGCWSPSSFGRCYRYQFLNRKGVAGDPIDARTLRKFKAGKLFHDFVEKLLPEHSTEVVCKNQEGDIFGYCDVVLDDMVIDIKSCHSYDFKRFWDKNKPYDVFKEKATNWLQVACYGMILKKKMCGLFFISKDDLVTEQFVAPVEKFVPIIEDELKELRGYWKRDEVPVGEPRAYGGKECKYCVYYTKCDSPNKTEE